MYDTEKSFLCLTNNNISNLLQTYSVTLTEAGWKTMSPGEAPRPVTRSDYLSILADLHEVLVRATLVDQLTHTYIADVAMDIAVPAETGQPLAENIEVTHLSRILLTVDHVLK